jgi:hypothetical protein
MLERGLDVNGVVVLKFIFKKGGNESLDRIYLVQDKDLRQTIMAADSIKCS